jgi:hypothetical protein
MSEIKVNMNTTERFIRIIIGGALLLASNYFRLGGPLLWVAVLLGLVFMLTGLAGFCPVYALCGWSTKKK